MLRDAPVDPRGPRFSALLTSIVLALVLLTGSWRLLAAQAALFGLCAFVSLRLNPWGQVYRSLVQPRLEPATQQEEAAPLRFAQGVGFIFSLVGVVGYVFELSVLGVVATSTALIAALVNGVFGLCLGCEMFVLLRRYTPAVVRANNVLDHVK